jgi:tRNA 2-thiocytidine biosynthesis protein TtcA
MWPKPTWRAGRSTAQFPSFPAPCAAARTTCSAKQIGNMLRDWEKQYPGRIESMFAALQNVVPSAPMDTKRHDFQNIRTTGVPEPEGDIAFDAPGLPAPRAPGAVQLVQL